MTSGQIIALNTECFIHRSTYAAIAYSRRMKNRKDARPVDINYQFEQQRDCFQRRAITMGIYDAILVPQP